MFKCIGLEPITCPLLGCPRKLGSMVSINGLFHLLINGVFLGVITY